MKKILTFVLVMAIMISILPGISAPIQVQIIPEGIQPGASIVNDYCVPDYYSIGTFTLAQRQIVSVNIPPTACPPVKQGPILGMATIAAPIGQLNDIGLEADFSVIDIPQYQYTCYYKSPCPCIIPEGPNGITNGAGQVGICPPRGLQICVTSPTTPCLSIRIYGDQGPISVTLPNQVGPNEWCTSIPIAPDIVRIEIQNCGDPLEGEVVIWECCCYDCYKQKALPTTLYPKIDIETFSVAGGPTVIQNGKVISKFQMTPGSQQVLLQVENRGFFTQNDTRLKFEGLPEGITVEIAPETQKINAHNIGTYSANFTVGPNVPSGTYQVTMVAYSPNGMFDKITFEFVVQ
ncbi:MAG: hypothetical protein HPY60_01115 [Candidatus Methanofastidiosum sp.]|nr:hypothetical protein [Methanofastidiosum sp.]